MGCENVVIILDGWRRICYCSPELEEACSTRVLGHPIEQFVAVLHRSATIQNCSAAILRGRRSQWMLTDLLTETSWLARIEPITTSNGSARAVVTLRPACQRTSELSDMQRAVLRLLAGRKTISEIAAGLTVSENTIRTHLRRAKEVTKQPSLIHLAAWAGANQHAL